MKYLLLFCQATHTPHTPPAVFVASASAGSVGPSSSLRRFSALVDFFGGNSRDGEHLVVDDFEIVSFVLVLVGIAGLIYFYKNKEKYKLEKESVDITESVDPIDV